MLIERLTDAFERPTDAFEQLTDAVERLTDGVEQLIDLVERPTDAFERPPNRFERLTNAFERTTNAVGWLEKCFVGMSKTVGWTLPADDSRAHFFAEAEEVVLSVRPPFLCCESSTN